MVLIRKRPGGLIARVARSLCLSGGLLSAEDRSNVRDASLRADFALCGSYFNRNERRRSVAWSMLNLWLRDEPW